MNADEARRFVNGKVFAFTCFDGTRGAGRIMDDLGAAGSVQFSGSGPIRHVRLPGNTLQIRGQAVCASIKGLPFEPCFNLDKRDDRSFRGSVSGMGFAYCDFRHQGASQMLMARSVARPRSLLRREEPARSASDARAEVGTARVADAGGRERQARAGEVRAEGGAGQVRAGQVRGCAGAAPLDRLIERAGASARRQIAPILRHESARGSPAVIAAMALATFMSGDSRAVVIRPR